MDIESLDNTVWDVLISGTGLRESLLAAALSRAGKKVLHIDKYPYYGDEYAAFSLDELETWTKTARDHPQSAEFKIHESLDGPTLAKSRSYTLNLAPGLLYTTSPLLSLLVSSNLHESLEFLKVGSWFVYDPEGNDSLMPVPSSREDVFNNSSIDARTKRLVVRALKSIIGLEGTPSASNKSAGGTALYEHLSQAPLSLPPKIIAAFTSLTLSDEPPQSIPFEIAEEKIRNYFGAIGRFGPGFSAVIGRYGSGSELVQVLCRAAAVTGNAVYVLQNKIMEMKPRIPRPIQKDKESKEATERSLKGFQVHLQSGDTVWAEHIVGKAHDIPNDNFFQFRDQTSSKTYLSRGLYIVSSPLKRLFQTNDPPVAAGTVIYFSPGSMSDNSKSNRYPIYIFGHSSETGECPEGQCILYASMKHEAAAGSQYLDLAVASLLQANPNDDGSIGQILMSTKYEISAESTIKDYDTALDGLHILTENFPDIEISSDVVVQALDLYEMITGSREGFMEKEEMARMEGLTESIHSETT